MEWPCSVAASSSIAQLMDDVYLVPPQLIPLRAGEALFRIRKIFFQLKERCVYVWEKLKISKLHQARVVNSGGCSQFYILDAFSVAQSVTNSFMRR